MISLHVFLVELDAEHAQRVPGAEQGGVLPPQVKLKERQKFFEEAFQQDMEQYLSAGYLQIAERRGEKEGAVRSEVPHRCFRFPLVCCLQRRREMLRI